MLRATIAKDAELSPIAPLLASIEWSPFAVAPELARKLHDQTEACRVEILADRGWVLQARPKDRCISLSVGVVEVLWAQAFAVWTWYDHLANTTPAGATQISLNGPDQQAAIDLYEWALRRLVPGRLPEDWPSSQPTPEATPRFGSPVHFANEWTLVTIGYLLLHEIAHLVLKHDPNAKEEWLLDQEKDADVWAADWVLVGGPPPRDTIVKRSTGAMMGCLALVSRDLRRGYFTNSTHPPSYDRLHNLLRDRVPEDIDQAWGVVVAVLSVHYHAVKRTVPTGTFDTWAEAADAFFDDMSRISIA